MRKTLRNLWIFCFLVAFWILDCEALCGFNRTASLEDSTLDTPGYPRSYSPFQECQWTLRAIPGYQIEFTVHDGETEPCCDYLELLDGRSRSSPTIGFLKGNVSVSRSFTSTSGYLTVRFVSDYSIEKRGFTGSYRLTRCGFNRTASLDVAILNTPGYPRNYNSSQNCQWTLEATSGYRVQFTVHSGESEECCDYLEVFDGPNINSPSLGRVNGTVSLSRCFTSTTRHLTIRFISDYSIERRGFNGSYNLNRIDCVNRSDPANSISRPSKSSWFINDSVTYSCEDGYQLLGSATSRCDDNREWTNDLPVCAALPESSFYLTDVELNFEQSRQHCRSRGGDLAIIQNQQVQDYLTAKVKRLYPGGVTFYIGLKRVDTFWIFKHGQFQWINGKRVSDGYQNWNIGEPNYGAANEYCGTMFVAEETFWNDIACYRRFFAVCETDYNPCINNPCLNGGNCSKTGNTFSCECPAYVDGDRCENVIQCHAPVLHPSLNTVPPRNADSYRVGTRFNLICGSGKTFVGNPKHIECQRNESWSGTSGVCSQVAVEETENCGKAGDTRVVLESGRVINGNTARRGAWPWYALISKTVDALWELRKGRLGGGTLINHQWVLTAAHIFAEVQRSEGWHRNYRIVLGTFTLSMTKKRFLSDAKIFEPEKIILHERFKTNITEDNLQDFDYDVAVIKLGREYDLSSNKNFYPSARIGWVNYTSLIRPVCLPCMENSCVKRWAKSQGKWNSISRGGQTTANNCEAEGDMFVAHNSSKNVVIGYGRISTNNSGKFPKSLQQARVDIKSSDECSSAIPHMHDQELSSTEYLSSNYTYTDRMICALGEYDDSVTDACQGDSGGGLIREIYDVATNTSCWIQLGIVSWGYGCAKSYLVNGTPRYYPGYYTNVFSVMNWIKSHIDRRPDRIKCVARSDPADSVSSPSKSLWFSNDIVSYVCLDGYQMYGSATSRCQENGRWSTDPPACLCVGNL